MAHQEGKTVFVPFTIEGERVHVRIRRAKKRYAEAELLEVIVPSPHRTRPGCPYFGRCGGCRYQHMDYAHQLEVKARQVEQTLQRIGKIADVPMRPMVASPRPYTYRNRITVHAQDGVIGFYRYDAHRLIDVERCPISRDEVNERLRELRARKPQDGHYTLRVGTGERVFQQVNDEVAQAMQRVVAGMMPARVSLLIDAYCGSGFFTKALRERAEEVIGLEWDRFAVQAAARTSQPNERYITGDVGIELEPILRNARLATTAVIVDPPGTGLAPPVKAALVASPVGALIYVSCNPATLARDLHELQARYRLDSVTPLDMFPQTAEIEVAVRLTRREETENPLLPGEGTDNCSA